MGTPLVSIAVITYNQVEFIAEAVRSAAEQDYDPLEVVVADDGSTDGTADLVSRLAKEYPKRVISLVGGPNLGITGNSNRALRACNGKYVAFQGGDDVLLPGKISKQVEWLEANEQRVLCGHRVEVFYENGRSSSIFPRVLRRGKGPARWIELGPLFAATSIMIRAAAMPSHGFDERMRIVSDGLFFVECLAGGGWFGSVPGLLARCRKHGGNVTNATLACIDDLRRVYEVLWERYPALREYSRRGRANLISYGLGMHYLAIGEPRASFRCFAESLWRNPRNIKTLFRCLEAARRGITG